MGNWETDTDWGQVSTFYGASLALKKDGVLWAWGGNAAGLYGNGREESLYYPIRISKDERWQSIAPRWYSVPALRTDGSLWAWGNNAHGQLGQGDFVYRSTPFAVP